jgi:chemotaxis protein MotB
MAALQEAVARGDIQVETLGDNVVVNFTPTEAEQKDLPQLLQQTLNAIEKAKAATGKSEQDVLFGGIEGQLAELAAAASAAAKSTKEQAEAKAESNKKAQIAEDELKVALRQEIGQGLADVQREDDKVIITVGAGGAFASGSANLTPAAIEIMNRIAEVNAAGKSKIKVSGHTDDVPLIFGSNYRDNWDLAAARSASVVQAFAANRTISEDRLEAISYGESRPVEPNDTAEGRAKNRRIEIEINY